MTELATDARERMRLLYDAYYASKDYDQRYPAPNPGTLDFLLRQGTSQAAQLADVGCGSGRYAIPLLEAGAGQLIACDISSSALAGLAARAQARGLAGRIRMVLGSADALPGAVQLDAILLMFGVLSHVGPRAERLALLRQLRRRAAPQGRLLMSVPSRWRRRPQELIRSLLGPGGALGDIEFTRVIAGRPRTFFYHLYTLKGLREELAQTGWRIEVVEAESAFPEWAVTQWPALGCADRWLQRWIPAALGYGIRVAARPDPAWSETP